MAASVVLLPCFPCFVRTIFSPSRLPGTLLRCIFSEKLEEHSHNLPQHEPKPEGVQHKGYYSRGKEKDGLEPRRIGVTARSQHVKHEPRHRQNPYQKKYNHHRPSDGVVPVVVDSLCCILYWVDDELAQ